MWLVISNETQTSQLLKVMGSEIHCSCGNMSKRKWCNVDVVPDRKRYVAYFEQQQLQ